MKILLINNNPVVSRLTALSARKENIEIDEIQEVTELDSNSYDIVFVDGDSWSKDVKDVIDDHLKTKKSVLFYAEGDNEEKESFDLTILKPFLPSEVSAVIRSIEALPEVKSDETLDTNFDILAESKESNRDELFNLDDLTDEKLVAEVELKEDISDSFDKKLEDAFPLSSTLDDDLFDDKTESMNKELKTEELFDLDLGEEKLTLEDELFTKEEETTELFDLDEEKIKIETVEKAETLKETVNENLGEELENDFVLESDMNVLEETSKETKILDKNEIENIKGLLSEDVTNDEMTLDDLMPSAPLMALESNDKTEIKKEEKEKKKRKKVKESSMVESDVLLETIGSLSIEKLRELLAGARVNISIKFPKAK